MRRSILVSSALLAVVACTQDFDAFDPLDAATSDATFDTNVVDAKPPVDSSVVDASVDALLDVFVDAPIDAPADVVVDSGTLQYACGNTMVSDCAQCSGKTEPCVFCQQNNPSVHAGVCAQLGQSCFGSTPNNFNVCGCNGNNVAACPADFQVCRNQSCRTCSDSNNNGGLACKGGGTCTQGACK